VRKADAATYATLAALADRPVGVKTGTTSEDYVTSKLPAGTTIVSLPETEALFVALGSSNVDGVIADFPINGYRSTLDTAVTVTERFSTGEQYGLAVAPDNLGLVDDINDALEDYLSSDDYTDLQFRWFGQ
jgi:ABC-type amino acid transport substrate-binding protein